MKFKVEEGGFLPTRAHETDAGMDLYSPVDILVRSNSSVVIDTLVRCALPPCMTGFVKSKSGLNMKHELTSEGVIDEPYRGTICVKLRNHGSNDYQVKRGDKISQLVVLPVVYCPIEQTDELDMDTDRGEGGFGSTGR